MATVRGPPLDTAAIISTTIEGILYGFSVLMFCLTLWVLVRGKKFSEVNHAMFTVAWLLFIFSTIHIGVDINRIYLGFVKFRDTIGPVNYFQDVSQQTFVFKNAIYSFQTAVGDGVVLYRAYAVWRSPWPVLLPFLVYCGVIASSIGSVYTVSITTPQSAIFFARAGQWITAFYASTFSCNLLATITLAVRLWWIERKASHFKGNRSTLWPIFLIVIDSGLLYSLTLFSALMCFVTNSNAQYIVLDFVTPIISISFYGVILRVALVQASREKASGPISNPTSGSRNHTALGRSGVMIPHGESYHHVSVGGNDSRGGYFGTRSHHSRSSPGDDDGYPMKPLKVNITQEVTHDVSDAKPWESAA